MNKKKIITECSISRRNFISNSGKIATASALSGVTLPMVHGKSSDAKIVLFSLLADVAMIMTGRKILLARE